LKLFAAPGLAALSGMQSLAHSMPAVGNAELANEADGTDWPAYGRTFSESRFSPLSQAKARESLRRPPPSGN
jgi:quinohemoprotein ethanol dehydrogenase